MSRRRVTTSATPATPATPVAPAVLANLEAALSVMTQSERETVLNGLTSILESYDPIQEACDLSKKRAQLFSALSGLRKP